MEKIKKKILLAVTTGTTNTGGTIIIPDLTVDYYIKIGLKQSARDMGFFDTYIEPEVIIPPEPPEETFNLVDSNGNAFVDNNGDNLIY